MQHSSDKGSRSTKGRQESRSKVLLGFPELPLFLATGLDTHNQGPSTILQRSYR
jgi:hypothetical protein